MDITNSKMERLRTSLRFSWKAGVTPVIISSSSLSGGTTKATSSNQQANIHFVFYEDMKNDIEWFAVAGNFIQCCRECVCTLFAQCLLYKPVVTFMYRKLGKAASLVRCLLVQQKTYTELTVVYVQKSLSHNMLPKAQWLISWSSFCTTFWLMLFSVQSAEKHSVTWMLPSPYYCASPLKTQNKILGCGLNHQ